MKKVPSLIDKVSLAVALSVVKFQAAHAQEVNTLVSNMESQGKSLGKSIAGVVQVVILIAAIVMLIMIVVESLKPQSQSRDGLVRLFAIIIVALAALSIFKAFL